MKIEIQLNQITLLIKDLCLLDGFFVYPYYWVIICNLCQILTDITTNRGTIKWKHLE